MATLPNQRTGIGRKPVLIVVDATVGFTDSASPLGSPSEAELASIARLLAAFRAHALPVVYTVNAYESATEASVFRTKVPLLDLLTPDSPLSAIAPGIEPRPGEKLLRKTMPSAFFDTPLRHALIRLGVDTAVVCGFTTSGCVRATAVDALQCNFRLIVVADACGDRDGAAHASNLRDLGLKYGDVVTTDEALALLQGAKEDST